ncbi:MAG: Tol-Pal system protein TolQ [Chlamydiales bacterium]|nr:Tol-Pal system protein TolQ [Chlamydiales bacterium]
MKLVPILATDTPHLDLVHVFRAAPLIYSILLTLSLFAFVVWLYSFLTVRQSLMIPSEFLKTVRGLLLEKRYDAALSACQKARNFSGSILACAIMARAHGHQVMVEAMQTEGKRCGVTLWQRISLINDVAVIAPMLGLLGTVLGLFYAFYDVNRSPDTLASIFDGLGIAVGTTVAGLIVAILAMVFYATLKFRIVQLLTTLENETLALGNLIET